MSRKRIWIAACVFLILAGIYALLLTGILAPRPQNEVSQVVLQDAILSIDKDHFAKLSVHNPSGDFSFTKDGETWICTEKPEITLEQVSVNSFSWDYVSLKPLKTIDETPSDLTSYGLKDPQASVTIETIDGTTHTVRLGNAVEGRNGYYAQVDDHPAVYLVSIVEGENLLHPLDYYRSTALFSVSEDTVCAVSYRYEGVTYELRKTGKASWEMVQPYSRQASQSNLIEAMVTPALAWKIEAFYDSMQPEECGLNESACFLQLSGEEEGDRLLIGAEAPDGLRYAKWEHKPGVFAISSEVMTCLQTDPFTYLDRYVYLPHIDTVESFTGTVGDRKLNMKIDRSGKEPVYFIDDQKVEGNQWKSAFQILLNVEIAGVLQEKPEQTDPVVSFTAERTDGSRDTVVYSPMGDRYYVATVNGSSDFYVSKNAIDAVIEGLHQ